MKNHPKALVMLFFTEMWERFSFYGMRALLMLYLTVQLFRDLFEPEKSQTAIGVYAAYGALVYATPFIGGLIADKFLGHRKAVIWGAVLMAIGHFVMAIETEFWLYIALAFLILGNGFFKPNISSIVGELYHQHDIRRDGGFTIFYMGVNLGAFLAPLVCGTIGELYDWKYGFGLAGFGMIAGLIIFLRNQHMLNVRERLQQTEQEYTIINEPAHIGEPSNPERLHRKIFLGITTEYVVYILSFFLVAGCAYLVYNFTLMSNVLTYFATGVLVLIFIMALRSPKVERERLFVVLILLLFSSLFWAFFEQAGSSFTLFTNTNVNRNFFSWQIPTSVFQSVNPFFILLLATPFTFLWLRLAQHKKETSTPAKFAIGKFLLSLGFLILGFAPHFVSQIGLEIPGQDFPVFVQAAAVPLVFLILSYLLQTMGELCLSPIGLSMVTKLSSPKNVGMIMGAWFLSVAFAHHIAGFIAKQTTVAVSTEDVMWQYMKANYSETTYTVTQEDFEKDYKGPLSKALYKGVEVILSEGNTITNTDDIHAFPIGAIVDSVMTSIHRQNAQRVIADSSEFAGLLQATFSHGISHIYDVGNNAVNHAIQEDFVQESESNGYSITTRYSLSNLLQYTKVFWSLGLIALVASIILLVLSPRITKMMHGA